MISYILLGFTYFGMLTLADKIGGYTKAGHRINFLLTVIFLGIYYILNNFN